MDIKELKDNLSDNDIYTLLDELGASPRYERGNIVSQTICHCGDSHKLYYYTSSRQFHCYTHCGSFDVIELIKEVKSLDFYPALKWLASRFGMSVTRGSHDNSSVSEDLAILKRWKRKEKETVQLPELEDSLIEGYYDIYHEDWINDHISPITMQLFNIKVSILDQAIIIPHYDKDGKMIGIRKRNMNPDLVRDGLKYVPLRVGKNLYNHPTGANLYGLNVNMEHIKYHKTLVLGESEKFVMQLHSMYPNASLGACVSGSFLTNVQLDIIKELGLNEVIIAMDKEYKQNGTLEEQNYAKKIMQGFVEKLQPYTKVSIIWDTEGLLEEKDSPTDKGKEVFEKLMKNRIVIN